MYRMMAFRGVRSSWLMLARNWLLARLAISAASLALSSSRMSRRMPMAPITRPVGVAQRRGVERRRDDLAARRCGG